MFSLFVFLLILLPLPLNLILITYRIAFSARSFLYKDLGKGGTRLIDAEKASPSADVPVYGNGVPSWSNQSWMISFVVVTNGISVIWWCEMYMCENQIPTLIINDMCNEMESKTVSHHEHELTE